MNEAEWGDDLQTWRCPDCPVQPSSTVDEDSVRLDVVRMAKNVYDRYKSELPIHNEVQAAIEKYVGDYPPKNIND